MELENAQCAIEKLSIIKNIECKCSICQRYCQQKPCWGTPEDIKKLIGSGYANRLMLNYYTKTKGENVYFPSTAVKGYEGKPAPFWPGGICTFYNFETGLCEIHTLKPLEGKTVYHESSEENTHILIVSTWDTEDAQIVRVKWQEITGCRDLPHGF